MLNFLNDIRNVTMWCVIMLSVIMLSVVMVNLIVLNFIILSVGAHYIISYTPVVYIFSSLNGTACVQISWSVCH